VTWLRIGCDRLERKPAGEDSLSLLKVTRTGSLPIGQEIVLGIRTQVCPWYGGLYLSWRVPQNSLRNRRPGPQSRCSGPIARSGRPIVKCVRRLALLPALVSVGVVIIKADGKGRVGASGEIKDMQIKDEGAMEARAEPKKNESCTVDTSRLGRRWGWVVHLKAHPDLAWVAGCRGGRRGCVGRWGLMITRVHFPAWRRGWGCCGAGGGAEAK